MSKNRNIALFIGAGASRACGYPLTADILPHILERLRNETFKDEHIIGYAQSLKRFLARLIPNQDSVGSLPQITEILSIIDYCLESGEELLSAGQDRLKLGDARWLLERAMSRVIRKTYKRELVPREIVRWVSKQERAGANVTYISTNYDFSLDRVLFQELGNWNVNYLRTDFGFTWRDPDDGALVHPSPKAKLRLYKLHGSLNWLGCSRCGNIYVNFERTVVTLADGTGEWSQCHCGFKPLRAVLVAPSFVRRYRDRNLLSVWRNAAEALRLADEWVFTGYSLPPEDIGIRALLLRARFSRSRQPDVRVVSKGNDALIRYRQLFPKCRYTGDGLKSFLEAQCVWE
jgi:NAD-dependent SIR2 family protein deacetylase